MTTCALCVDAEATETLERKGRTYRLCFPCTMATLKLELDSGCRIGETWQAPAPLGPRELTWAMVGRSPSPMQPGTGAGRIAPKPDLDQLDRYGTRLDYGEGSYRRQTR